MTAMSNMTAHFAMNTAPSVVSPTTGNTHQENASLPFTTTSFSVMIGIEKNQFSVSSNAPVAQRTEHHLAKVKVEVRPLSGTL